MSLPDLFIGGPPKCGTSSLYRWLDDHPEACGSDPKETFYLMDEGHPLMRSGANVHKQGVEGYQPFFSHCAQEGNVMRFEATTHYIYQQTARTVIADGPSHPDVLFVLREPAQRVWSSFRYTKNNLANVSSDLSFKVYVDAVLGDRFGDIEHFFFDKRSAYVLQRDIQYSQYVDYLIKWKEAVGSGRLEVLLFEELESNPRAFMKNVARRFSLDPSFYDRYDFAAKNKSYEVRNQTIHRVARALNRYIGGKIKKALKQGYMLVQKRQKKQITSEEQEALQILRAHFQPHIRRLSSVFDLDLSCWR